MTGVFSFPTKPNSSPMKTNVGTLDRSLRAVAGLALLGVGLYFKSWWGLVGLVPLLTATTGYCPAYVPFGLSTCSLKKKS
jgi:hypothetical protein